MCVELYKILHCMSDELQIYTTAFSLELDQCFSYIVYPIYEPKRVGYITNNAI